MTCALIELYAEPNPVAVARTGPGSYVNGTFQPGTASGLSITACIIPLKPAEIAVLDLGQHVTAAIRVYTETPLQTASETAHDAADVITWQGDQYVVMSVAYRGQIPGQEHYAVTAVRKEGT